MQHTFPPHAGILNAMKSNGISGRSWESMDAARVEAAVRGLAQFRHALHRFLRFSEDAARRCGVTPQQHQLLLGIQGSSHQSSANVSELAEFLQEQHHSVVGLVERAVQSGLVRRAQDAADRRVVNVTLTARGKRILLRLTRMHYEEARRLRRLWETCELPRVARAPRKPGVRRGATRTRRSAKRS
jgi:DNA-binding MarR family transcriptional regulator